MGRPREVSDQEILSAAREEFLRRGTAIPISTIAAELGISHATIFNRFGSKEDLMIAALGPPKKPVSVTLLENGPDDRATRDQLEEALATLSREVAGITEGVTLLRGAGIPTERIQDACQSSGPVEVHKALSAWLRRAQDAGGIGVCNVDLLAHLILSTLRDQTRFITDTTAETIDRRAKERAHDLVLLLWRGIAP